MPNSAHDHDDILLSKSDPSFPLGLHFSPFQQLGVFLCFNLCLPHMGFLSGSVGKESACYAGDPGLIPGLGRFSGEGTGYPLQYSWASLVAQLVKKSACNAGDLGSVPELGRSLEKGKSIHSSTLAWRIP